MTWRALLAAAIFLGLVVTGILLVRRDEPAPAQPDDEPQPKKTLSLETPPAPLSRAELIEAAARAADAAARGVPPPPDLQQLSGRRFVLKSAFGCKGPTATGGDVPSLGWTYDSETQTLRVTVTPQVWTDATYIRALAGETAFEAAEGFWISRPWLRAGDCPVVMEAPQSPPQAAAEDRPSPAKTGLESPVPGSVPAATETLGIVELFEPGSPRAARRNGRPFELVSRIGPGEIDLAGGLRLVLEGSLEPLSSGRPVACLPGTDANARPLCLIAAEIGRVAVTDSSGQRLLAEWRD